MEKAVRTLGISDKYQDVDPGKALLEEISVTYAHVQWLRGKVAEVEGNQLIWGRTQHEEGIGPEGPIDKTTMKAEPSPWHQLYLREREYLVKVTTAALKAGIEERKARLAESQGELVARVIPASSKPSTSPPTSRHPCRPSSPANCAPSPLNKAHNMA